jgi:heat-inducible transcriptional repressor
VLRGDGVANSNDGRLMEVLDAVVSSYIRLGTPVGSRYISTHFDIGLGPASIRHLLAELENRGLVAKPHVSAGRVPTERAFRSYLDRLGSVPQVTGSEARAVREALVPDTSLGELMERVSRLLGRLSSRIGAAVVPDSHGGRISGIETVAVGQDRFMLTVAIEPGTRRSATLIPRSEAEGQGLQDEIARISGIVVGRQVTQARQLLDRLRLQAGRRGVRLHGLWDALDCLLRDRGCEVHLSGRGNLVSELPADDRLRMFLEVLESKQMVADMLLSGPSGGSSVTLGFESGYLPLRGCSVISSRYNIGEAEGALGIIGPVRMDYPRLLAVLNYTSDRLTRLFAGREGDTRSAGERTRRPGRA